MRQEAGVCRGCDKAGLLPWRQADLTGISLASGDDGALELRPPSPGEPTPAASGGLIRHGLAFALEGG